MDLDATPPPVSPKPQPGLIKTIGILNLLFGGALFLCGLGCLKTAVPAVLGTAPMQLEPKSTQAFYDEIRRQRIQALKDQEKGAPTEAERDKIKKERSEFEAKQIKVEDEIDFPKVNAGLRPIPIYLRADVLTGPVLNLLMLFAGVGLILRKNWARVLGMVIALLKIVRLVGLAIFLAAVVIPRASDTLDALVATDMGRQVLTNAMEEQARQGGAPMGPQPTPQDIVKILRGSGIVSAVFFVCVGSVYPAIALILLSLPGARAACETEKEPGDVMPEV